MKRVLFIIFIPVLFLNSCFVKEDRTPCPCWLELDMREVTAESVTVTGWDKAELFRNDITLADYPDCYEVTVPRSKVTVAVYAGHPDIPKGFQADSLYMYSATLDTDCETRTEVVRLHKQFSTVHLILQIPDGCKVYPYDVIVSGTVEGIDPQSFSPKEGVFRHMAGRIGENEFVFRVPRQLDSSLMIEMYDAGKKVDEVPLGEVIVQSGYDWNAKDLADISLDINFRESQVAVRISDWRETVLFDVKL